MVQWITLERTRRSQRHHRIWKPAVNIARHEYHTDMNALTSSEITWWHAVPATASVKPYEYRGPRAGRTADIIKRTGKWSYPRIACGARNGILQAVQIPWIPAATYSRHKWTHGQVIKSAGRTKCSQLHRSSRIFPVDRGRDIHQLRMNAWAVIISTLRKPR